MQDTPKRLKHLVREWAAVAHDRELTKALLELRAQFDRWQRGEIAAADLNALIHEFHQGAARDIWKTYATNHLAPAIGFAVANGILRREELPAELLQDVAGLIEFYEADRSASQRLGRGDGREKPKEFSACSAASALKRHICSQALQPCAGEGAGLKSCATETDHIRTINAEAAENAEQSIFNPQSQIPLAPHHGI